MALPGFTAEAAVYSTARRYRMHPANGGPQPKGAALEMQYWCGDCWCGPSQMCQGEFVTDSHGHSHFVCACHDTHIVPA
jgi:hypothetical protein